MPTIAIGGWGLIEWMPSAVYGIGYLTRWGGRFGWRHGSLALGRLRVWW